MVIQPVFTYSESPEQQGVKGVSDYFLLSVYYLLWTYFILTPYLEVEKPGSIQTPVRLLYYKKSLQLKG